MKLRLVVIATLLCSLHHVLSEDGEFSSDLETVVQDPTVLRAGYIVGSNGSLWWSKYEVWFGNAESAEELPIWHIYSDGTIRPQNRPDRCVSYDYDETKIVILETCGLLPRAESWSFTDKGTILNLKRNLVMEVKGDGGLERKKLQLAIPSGAPNQMFQLHEVPKKDRMI